MENEAAIVDEQQEPDDRKSKSDQIVNEFRADKITATEAFAKLVDLVGKPTMTAILVDGLNREMSGEPIEPFEMYMTLSEYKSYKDQVWDITKTTRQLQKIVSSQQKAMWAEAKKYPETFKRGEPLGITDDDRLVNPDKAKQLDDEELAKKYPKVDDERVIDNIDRMQEHREKGEERLITESEEFTDWLFELCEKKGYRGIFPPIIDEDGKIREITKAEVERRQSQRAMM